MWNATFATFFQEQFPMRMRVTGFAVSQNVGLAIASLFPTLFTAIAPPGSTNVPLVIGLAHIRHRAVAALAAFFTPETKGKSLDDLEARKSDSHFLTSPEAQDFRQVRETAAARVRM